MPRPDSTADRAMLEQYRETLATMAGLFAQMTAQLDRLAEIDPPLTPQPEARA